MANSSILGGTVPPLQPSGTDVDALGPSDTTDSGSDVRIDRGRSAMPDESSEGALPIAHESTSDASGTGERAAADGQDVQDGADVMTDRVASLDGDAMSDAVSIEDLGVEDLEAIASDEEDDDSSEPA